MGSGKDAVPEGFALRKGLAFAGVGLLVLGIVIFVICAVAVSQASARFLNCMNGVPINYPYGTVPPACTEAMSAFVLYGTLEWVGIPLGVVGFVLLLLGLLLEPPRPAPIPGAYYPPPAYGPASSYPPQGPPPQP